MIVPAVRPISRSKRMSCTSGIHARHLDGSTHSVDPEDHGASACDGDR